MYTIRRRARRRESFVLFLCLLLGAGRVFAHPMGNFSVNHYGKIKIGARSEEILYVLDMAEIPTYQEMRQSALTVEPNDPNDVRYLDGQATRLKEGLTLEIDDRPVPLVNISRRLTFSEGAGGLPTMKLAFVFGASVAVPAGPHRLSYADNNFPGRAGWKEIVVVSDGPTILESTAPTADRSNELSNYSTDLLNSPPQQLSALTTFQTFPTQHDGMRTIPASTARTASSATHTAVETQHSLAANQRPAQASRTMPEISTPSKTSVPPSEVRRSASTTSYRPALRSQNTPRSRFTELILTEGKLSFWILLSAALIAAGLGALHALEPGHGKTIVAAYLVGSRGTARHAVLLGIVVTAAHTAGVYLLGVVTLYASRYIVPEQLYPWLGALSGLSITGLGVFIFLRHVTGESGDHSHAPGEHHSHWFLSLFQQKGLPPSDKENSLSAYCKPSENRGVSLRELCVLGITGGIVPCPAALVVLLSAFAVHRIGFGLFLITAFSLGLAAVLVAVGLTVVYAKRFVAPSMRRESSALRYLPLVSSAFMVILGVGIAVSALTSASIGGLLSKDKVVSFVTVTLLGLFLGMRHSTDPDHVVAVSTIVSRQQSIKSSAIIGLLWGLGHTLTIFLVGSVIIIFRVVIPPRLGLSMEFCVALMLIMLGILNLTGVMQWITDRLTPPRVGVEPLSRGVFANSAPANQGKPASFLLDVETFLTRAVGKLGLYQIVRPLVVGLIHGLAGSAAVALLVLSAIRNPFWSTAYLVIFGFGTMAGMMLMTAAISAPLVFAGRKFFRINGHLTAVSGLASVAFGMFLVYRIGLVDGLFTSNVHWIPQ
jgi:ABC-type nickel/cobalt efflux system permease component RcnA